MTTAWNSLRSWNGSQEKAFEELCCQLAEGESYPGSTYIRKGTPDAGVECYWTLPGGDEHAWQAKFFLSPPTSGQWAQIDDSVKTALAKHPRLTRYTICLPIDRSDARQQGQKSFLDKWNERVGVWKRWAGNRHTGIQFGYWGDHELSSRLSREENRGRHWFWFTREQLTLQWFRKKLDAAIQNAGERYTPQLHVDLPIARYFAALGRTPAFHDTVTALYRGIREAASRFDPARLPAVVKEATENALVGMRTLSNSFDAMLLPIHDPTAVPSLDPIRWDDLKQAAQPLHDQLDRMSSALWDLMEERRREKQQTRQEEPDPSARALEEAWHYSGRFRRAVSNLLEFCASDEARVADRPALLLVGKAGQGKTHLLCDLAEKDLKEGRPRLLLHGMHFRDEEPWSQIVTQLGLNCPSDDLLGALEAAGRAYGCRILILIDALNEGEGRGLWVKYLSGMLSALVGNPWVGIAISVRSSYEELVIPQSLVPQRLTPIVHPGFEEHEYEAVNRFFVHYGIQPTTPLLLPEFTNPLFLKLFCQGVNANGWKQVPLGLRGITAILDMFLDATNRRLSKPDRMNYDPASNPVRKAIDALVRLMAKSGKYQLPREEALQAVNEVHKTDGYDRSLFRNLLAEGIIAENRWRTEGGHADMVFFAYERFADHLLAKYLLETSFNRKAPKQSFGRRTKLGRLLGERASWQYAGLIEALSVQLPETAGRELADLAPHAANTHTVRDGFIKSLVWRDSKAFTQSTFKHINRLCRYKGPLEEILNAILTVAPIPDHPLNGDKLHEILSPLTMADRDSWWSIFLHSEWQNHRAVRRLIDWTWGESDKASLLESVVQLTGTTLAWFLTSSNRFLRDRSTKALVKLFENRLVAFRQLLGRFWSVQDPYVLERLLGAAYGCAMRSSDTAGLAELAADVSSHVFRKALILPQLLTRDYARGIVECARQRGAVPAEAFPESRPPYKSWWPDMRIPSAKTLEKWGKWHEGMAAAEWAQSEIYSSMRSGFGDFSRYVVGDLDEWTTIPLGTVPPKSLKEQVEAFVDQLRPAQRRALKQFEMISHNAEFYRRLPHAEREETFGHPLTNDQLDAVHSEAEARVARSFKGDSTLCHVFRTVVKPYIEDPQRHRLPHVFDADLARRWIIQRVIEYGWTAKRFGEFDHMVNRWTYEGRTAHKAERIGKKYQWIALREMLARLSDNFYMRQDQYSDKGLRVYTGPWDVGYSSGRDIDPSVVIRSTSLDDKKVGRTWWSPSMYSTWSDPASDIDWLKATADLPAIEPLLMVRAPVDGGEWYVLDTHCDWTQPARPGRERFEETRRWLWLFIRSYLVWRRDAGVFFRWAKRQDFVSERMPEPWDVRRVFVGECFWAPAFRESLREFPTDGWIKGEFAGIPKDVLATSLNLAHESSGFDCSIDDSFRIKLPAEALARGMRLRWTGSEGRYADPAGRLTAFDPSVFEPGPGALLIRRDALEQFLSDNGLELFWTVLGEKQLIGGGLPNEFGWLQISGVYRLTPGGIVGRCTAEYRLSARRPRRLRKRT